MRIWLGVFLAFAVVSCSVVPEPPIPECHHESKDCSSDAVRSRVLQTFSSARIEEVIACDDQPTLFCSSMSTDEEACLVRADPDALAEYRANQVQRSSAPPVVLKLFRDFGVHQPPDRVMYRQIPGPFSRPRTESIFTNSDRSLAVLYIAEVRCIDVTEIT